MKAPTDSHVLLMMEMTARAERDLGFTGWGKPPDEFTETCRRLVDDGLAEESRDDRGFEHGQAGSIPDR